MKIKLDGNLKQLTKCLRIDQQLQVLFKIFVGALVSYASIHVGQEEFLTLFSDIFYIILGAKPVTFPCLSLSLSYALLF